MLSPRPEPCESPQPRRSTRARSPGCHPEAGRCHRRLEVLPRRTHRRCVALAQTRGPSPIPSFSGLYRAPSWGSCPKVTESSPSRSTARSATRRARPLPNRRRRPGSLPAATTAGLLRCGAIEGAATTRSCPPRPSPAPGTDFTRPAHMGGGHWLRQPVVGLPSRHAVAMEARDLEHRIEASWDRVTEDCGGPDLYFYPAVVGRFGWDSGPGFGRGGRGRSHGSHRQCGRQPPCRSRLRSGLRHGPALP